MKIVFFLFVIAIISSCSSNETLRPGQDYLEVEGGKIWYQVLGDQKKTPIVLLHGGPGYPSYYLNPLKDLSQVRPVILFDQLGCGRSDRINDTDLMTIESHIDQIKKLTTFLKVDNFHLYGHSWGAMLALEYYLQYPEDIKTLIFASPSLNVNLWESDLDTLISMMPDSVQIPLMEMKTNTITDTVKLNQAINQFYQNFYFRKLPPSAELDSTLKNIGISVYQHMWGPNDFKATGILKNYDRTKDLEKIKVPTLYITGEFDGARPSTVRHYRSLTPNSEMKVINNAGHVTMHDASDENVKIINDFLLELQ